MSLPYLGAVGAHKRALIAITAIAAISAVALLLASAALLQPAAVAPKSGTAEGLGLKGVVNIIVRDANGNVKYERTMENAITKRDAGGLVALLDYSFKTTPTSLFATIRLLDASTKDQIGGGMDSGYPTMPAWDASAKKAKVVLRYTYSNSGTSAVTVGYLLITDSPSDATWSSRTLSAGTSVPQGYEAVDPSSGDVYVAGETPSVDTIEYPAGFTVFSIIPTTVSLNPGDTLTVTWTIFAGQA
jgi:hypothetical protein